MEMESLITSIGVGVALLGVAYTYFKVTGCYSARLLKLETQMALFWGVVEKHMATLLHSDNTPELDSLLDALRDGNINRTQMFKLRTMLQSEITANVQHNPKDNGRILTMAFLLARLEVLLHDKYN